MTADCSPKSSADTTESSESGLVKVGMSSHDCLLLPILLRVTMRLRSSKHRGNLRFEQ